MINVAILGCGPAGLLAAHGAKRAGGPNVNIRIYSLKKKSPMAGAQFIHREIPGIPVEESTVKFSKVGDREGYAKKVYGDSSHVCSWDEFQAGYHPCWPMKQIYEWLWGQWAHRIIHGSVKPEVLDAIERTHDVMISTIPASVLCHHPKHVFEQSTVRIASREMVGKENYVIYNGLDDGGAYRASQLFGWYALEFGFEQTVPPSVRYVVVNKPQVTDCDCRSKFLRIGRYGKWSRGVLVHHGYEEAYGAVHEVL